MPQQIHLKLYINHTVPNVSPSAKIPSSFCVSTVNPINPSPVITRLYTVLSVAMNNNVKTIDGLDHQYIPEDFFHHIDAHLFFTFPRTI